MKTNIRNLVSLLIMITITNTVFSQTTTKIYQISPIVGDTIDSEEKIRFGLFPFYKKSEFQYGVFYQLSDTTFLLKSLVNGSTVEKVFNQKLISLYKNMIEGFPTKSSLRRDETLAHIVNPIDSKKIYKIELKDGSVFTGNIMQKDSISVVMKISSIPKLEISTREIYISKIKNIYEVSKFVNKNSIYFELGGSSIYSLNYERSILFSKSFKLNLGIGATFLYVPGWVRYFVLSSKYSLIFGQRNSKLETGLGFAFGVGSLLTLAPNARLLWRYEGNKGFLFRAGIIGGLLFEKFSSGYRRTPLVYPEISFGKTF